jgi:hypothetical protein
MQGQHTSFYMPYYSIPTWSFHDLNIANSEDHVIMLINVTRWLLVRLFSLWVVWGLCLCESPYNLGGKLALHLKFMEPFECFFVGGWNWNAHNYHHPFSTNRSKKGNGRRPTPLSCTFSTLLSSSLEMELGILIDSPLSLN